MNKVFIFSLCGGSYEYAIVFIQAENLEEAVKIGMHKTEERYSYELLSSSNNIQGFNFDYKKHINKLFLLNYMNILPENHWNDKSLIENHEFFNKTYEELIKLAPETSKQILLDNSYYISTHDAFYDVMEVQMPVPKGYVYNNGHSG